MDLLLDSPNTHPHMAKNCGRAAFNSWNGSYLETQLWHFLCRELWESTQHMASEIQRPRTPLISDLRGISPLLTWPACHYQWGRGRRRMPGKSIQTLSLPSNSHCKLFYMCMSVCVCLVSSHEPTAIITAPRTDWREAKSDQAEMNVSWHTFFYSPLFRPGVNRSVIKPFGGRFSEYLQ